MGIIIVSGVLSLGYIWAVNKIARSPYWGLAGANLFTIAAIGLSFFSFFCIALPALTVQAALTFLSLISCAVFGLKRNAVLRLSIAAMAASYGYFLWDGIAKVQELSNLRSQYPLESVSDRLAYETSESKAHGELSDAPAPLSADVERELEVVEQWSNRHNQPWSSHRRAMLASLHTRKSDEFAMAQGFGRARMMGGRVSAAGIMLPTADPVALPKVQEAPYESDPEPSAPGDDTDQLAGLATPKPDLVALHESGKLDFVDPDRIGYVQDRDHVAGFQSHRFAKIPEFFVPQDKPPVRWIIARLELVSLLKHKVPVAYVSKTLPQMDELRDAPTRPLDEFERQSLDRLKSDEDVVTDESPDHIRMVGSLRAAKTCLECHSVRRGDLLGAFTYELVPSRATRQKPRQEPEIN